MSPLEETLVSSAFSIERAPISRSEAPQNKPPKRKASKEVFEFEDDFEEEVMPIPKKRASLNTSNDAEKAS